MTNNIHHLLAMLCLSTAALQSAACIDTGDERLAEAADEAADEAPTLSEAESMLGEYGCTSVSSDATAPAPTACNGGTSYRVSPDTSYGHGTQCPDQFVVEFTARNVPLLVGSGWAEAAPTNPTTCVTSHYSIGAYTRNALGVWGLSGVTKYSGVWDTATAKCSFAPVTGYSPLSVFSGTAYRLAVQAGQTICGSLGCTMTKHKALAMLISDEPC